jgi:hypothetical protein
VSAPGAASYLDAIFGGIRDAARDLTASQQWLARAEKTKDIGWRGTFVNEAHVRWHAASRALGEVEGQLGTSGVVRGGEGLSPVEQLQQNIASLRHKLELQEKRVGAAFLELGGGRRGSA